jgi:hypothetical protein
MKLPTARIFSVPYLMRTMQTKFGSAHMEYPEKPSVEDFRRCAGLVRSDDIPLTRVWTAADIEWQLHRHDGIAVHHRAGEREGMLTGYIMPAANTQRTKCLLVEDVLWGTLENEDRLALVKQLIDRAVKAGAQMAFLPSLGYADIAPFQAARFRSSPRILHAYLTVFNGQPAPAPVPSMYLDVI